MIQLANDPNASRPFSRAAAHDARRETSDAMRRSGHAWPFLSRMEARPARGENSPKPAAKDSGS
jgi:hypothetical protein